MYLWEISLLAVTDHRCSRTYSPNRNTEELTKICRDNVCRCTQGNMYACCSSAFMCLLICLFYLLIISRWLLHLQNWHWKLSQQRKRDICLQFFTSRYNTDTHTQCLSQTCLLESLVHMRKFLILQFSRWRCWAWFRVITTNTRWKSYKLSSWVSLNSPSFICSYLNEKVITEIKVQWIMVLTTRPSE